MVDKKIKLCFFCKTFFEMARKTRRSQRGISSKAEKAISKRIKPLSVVLLRSLTSIIGAKQVSIVQTVVSRIQFALKVLNYGLANGIDFEQACRDQAQTLADQNQRLPVNKRESETISFKNIWRRFVRRLLYSSRADDTTLKSVIGDDLFSLLKQFKLTETGII